MKLHTWLTTSLVRIFPHSPAQSKKRLPLLVARAERVSFQVAYRITDSTATFHASLSSSSKFPNLRIRRVGLVPVPHHNAHSRLDDLDCVAAADGGGGGLPGFVPDVLFPESTAHVGSNESHSFWITLTIPPDAKPGKRQIALELSLKDGPTSRLFIDLTIASLVLAPRKNFPITHWFYADAIADWYKVPLWSDPFWTLFNRYVSNYVSHGLDTLYVPLFTPPLDGVKRPTQLLIVKKTKKGYAFDWTHVKNWIVHAKIAGIKKWEWTHLFSQWGVKHALRIYESPIEKEKLLWPPETGATSDVYRSFLKSFLPEFKEFLDQQGLLADSFFHVSDEPHGDEALANYRAARLMLKELAPWMKVMDALSDIRYGKEGLTDTPIPSIHTALDYKAAGIDSWCYYCCWPRDAYLNRLMDTPLPKIRMNGWLFYRFSMKGFLHWGYNYWYKCQTRELIDPFTVSDGKNWPSWAFGDTFCVYPGPPDIGPIDSIRWEVFSESLQDYALLQTAGIDPESKLLAPMKSFEDFPKTQKWISATRQMILKKKIRRGKKKD